MKTMNVMKRYGAKVAAVPAVLALTAGQAFAEVPAEVTEALTTAKTDALQVGGIVLGILGAIFALMLIRRVLR